MSRLKHLLLPALAATAVGGFVAWSAISPLVGSAVSPAVPVGAPQLEEGLAAAVGRVDGWFARRWSEQDFQASAPADELQVLRRLWLALAGTIPSLEEVRAFEADARPDRLHRWTLRLLADRRFGEYFGERLAVAFVGVRPQDPPWFSRYRLQAWLADQLLAGRPYDEIVHEMISAGGPPTAHPAADFVTAEVVQGEQFANRLAARAVRAFLGQRIDCAECHDHPFDDWKQADFEGLAAYFAQVRTGAAGIEDDRNRVHEVEDRKTLAKRVVEPRVPFHAEWLAGPTRRDQLADWITHRQNRRFLRAIANRTWGLMFGRPLVTPVDSIPDPPAAEVAKGARGGPPSAERESALLDLLADDLREHQCDLRRLVLLITSSRPFGLDSTSADEDGKPRGGEPPDSDWAVFPLVQLRPEQLANSLQQSASIRPLRPEEYLVVRIHREERLRRFIEQYGSLGENELEERTANIPQMVDRMHGNATRRMIRADAWNAAGRIAAVSADDGACLETCYLVCLSRRPTPDEQRHFLPQLREARRGRRSRVVEDIFWALFNSPEFTWNH